MERPASYRSRRPPSPLLLLLPLLLLALAGLAKAAAQPVERGSLNAWADAEQVHVSQVDPDLSTSWVSQSNPDLGSGWVSQADPDGRVKQTQPALMSWGEGGGEGDHDGGWQQKWYGRLPFCRGFVWVALKPSSKMDPESCPAGAVETSSSCGFTACTKLAPGWHRKRLAEQRRAFDEVLVDSLGVLSHGSFPARPMPHHHHREHAPAHSPAPSPMHHHHKAPAPSPVHHHKAPAPSPVHHHKAPTPAPSPAHHHGVPGPAPAHGHGHDHGYGHHAPAPRSHHYSRSLHLSQVSQPSNWRHPYSEAPEHGEHPEHPEHPHQPWHPHPHGVPAKAPVAQHQGDKSCKTKWTVEGNVIEVMDYSKEEPMDGSAWEDKAGCKWVPNNQGNWLLVCVKCADVPPGSYP